MNIELQYESQARALDGEILQCIERRAVPDFNDLALRIFAHQLQFNEPYARYCASLGITPRAMPPSWKEIPAAPAGAFRYAALCTFDPRAARLVFHTSGTTADRSGKHYLESAALYDAALLASFKDAMLADSPETLRFVLLVPNPQHAPHSSLGYMMRRVAAAYGDGNERWLLENDAIDVGSFITCMQSAAMDDVPLCIAGTAFAFVLLLDGLRDHGMSALPAPEGSRIMETGGFKGRTRVVERVDLYDQLERMLRVPDSLIVAEYGMTELCSQYYDCSGAQQERVKCAPPWLRPRVVAPDGSDLPNGTVGTLVHVDLANRSTASRSKPKISDLP